MLETPLHTTRMKIGPTFFLSCGAYFSCSSTCTLWRALSLFGVLWGAPEADSGTSLSNGAQQTAHGQRFLEITLRETCLEAWPVLWYTINYIMIMIPPNEQVSCPILSVRLHNNLGHISQSYLSQMHALCYYHAESTAPSPISLRHATKSPWYMNQFKTCIEIAVSCFTCIYHINVSFAPQSTVLHSSIAFWLNINSGSLSNSKDQSQE
jgi:hypothetical protein